MNDPTKRADLHSNREVLGYNVDWREQNYRRGGWSHDDEKTFRRSIWDWKRGEEGLWGTSNQGADGRTTAI